MLATPVWVLVVVARIAALPVWVLVVVTRMRATPACVLVVVVSALISRIAEHHTAEAIETYAADVPVKPLSLVATSKTVVGLAWLTSCRSVQLAFGTDPAVVVEPAQVSVIFTVRALAGRTGVGTPVV
jgi:hypothetical protein